jgi:precorrin-4/cobalt-precorrin-4 C11-methyltransferase
LSRAKVWFIGAGPGAPDLLTVRGAGVIGEADIVIWGANHVMEEAVTENARANVELIPWPPATMAEILAAYDKARAHDLVIARLVGGDPAVYVDMSEEMERARALELPIEVVPGVGALSAAAAALERELVTARTDHVLVIASPKAELESVMRPGVVGAVYMAGRDGAEIQRRLISAGWPVDTACAIVSSATWPEQIVIRCELAELGSALDQDELGRRTLVLVGVGGRMIGLTL